MTGPTVSVIVPCFNGAEHVVGCVRSVVEQQTPTEIILVDDGSSDDSRTRFEQVVAKTGCNAYLLCQKNQGAAVARNAGLRLASGKYVCFLDIDDRYKPGFFSRAVEHLETQPASVAISCGIELANLHRPVEPWHVRAIEASLPCNVLARTEVVRRIGGFPVDPALRGRAGGEDQPFRQALAGQGYVARIEEPLFIYTVRPGSYFDLFLDRARLENGVIRSTELTAEERDGSMLAAIEKYLGAIRRRQDEEAVETLQKAIATGSQFLQLQSRLGSVEGYLHDIEGFALYCMARYWPVQGRTLEVGSFKGKSTCWLAQGCKDGNRRPFVAIDHFRGSPEHQPTGHSPDRDILSGGSTLPSFEKNVRERGLAGWVETRVGSSAEIAREWREPVRLAFIDGDHSYQASKEDFLAWSPFVAPHGLMVFHDINVWPEVTRFYDELRASSNQWKEVARIYSLGALERIR